MAKDNNQNQATITDPNQGLSSLPQANLQEGQNNIQPTNKNFQNRPKVGIQQTINETVVDAFDKGVEKMDQTHITKFAGQEGKIIDAAAHYKQKQFHKTLEDQQERREFLRSKQDTNKEYIPNFKPKVEINKVKANQAQIGGPQTYDPNNPNKAQAQKQEQGQQPNQLENKLSPKRLVNPALTNQLNKQLSPAETKKAEEKRQKEQQSNFNKSKKKEAEENIKGQSRIPTDDEEDKKEKKRAVAIALLLGKIFLIASSILVGLILAVVVGVSLFGIFIISQSFCPIISQPIVNLAIPDNLKAFCKEAKNVDDGCFIPKGGRYTEEDYGINVNNSARPLSYSNPQSPILPCIGKALGEAEPTLEIYGLKGNITIKKDIINEIIQAGKEAKVEENTIKLAIAIYPTLSLENVWKESFTSGCYGIAQLCIGGIANSQGEVLDSNYQIATKDLGINDVQDYLESPVLQMKSIQKFIDYRRSQIKTLDSCFNEIFKGKIESYKLLYLWQDMKCEGDMEAIRVSKSAFAELAQSNFGLMDCNEFKTKIAFVPNYLYSNKPIVIKSQQKLLDEPSEIEKLSYAQAQGVFQSISNSECQEIKKYKPFLEEAANKYSTPTLILSPAIIAGILSRETQVGLYIKGCAGYGDFGNGHGIGQADPSSGNGLPGKYTPVGFKVNRVTKKFGKEEFIWSDCREGILYVGAHMMNLWEYADPIARNKITAAGLSLAVDEKGAFKDLKVKKGYMQLLLNAYNAGPTGMKNRCSIDSQGVVSDSCTSGRDYGKNTLDRSADAAKCLGITSDILDFVGNGGGGIGGVITGGINSIINIINGLPSFSDAVKNDPTKNFQGILCAGKVDAAKQFPLVTLTAKDVKIYYNFAYGDPWPNGQKSDGMFFAPDPVDPENTRVIAVQNGEIINDHIESFTYCIPGGTAADCKTENVREIDIMGDNGTLHCYVQMDPSPSKRFLTTGAKVKPGDIIGQILNNKYVHLRFRAFLPGDNLGEPKTTIKWDNNIQPTATKETKGLIPKEWHQRDEF